MASPDKDRQESLSEVGCEPEEQREERQSLSDENNAVKLLSGMQELLTRAFEITQTKTASRECSSSGIQFIPFNPDDSEADIEGWCRVTELFVQNKGLEGFDLLVALTGALKGRAATCITKLNLSELSWSVVKQTLLAKFSEPKLPQDHFDEILRFQISPKETASEAALRLWNMIESLPKTEMPEDVISGFVISVLSQKDDMIRRELNSQVVTSRAQLFRTLGGISMKRRIEGLNTHGPEAKRARLNDSNKFPGNCHWCGIPGHRIADCKKRKGGVEASTSTPRAPTRSIHSPQNAQTTCFSCGKPGHIATVCPDKSGGGNNTLRKDVNICEQRLSRGTLRTLSGRVIVVVCASGVRSAVKLAASALSMNPHYHGYAELSSPHPPSPEPAFANGHDYPHNNNNPALKECAGCGGKIVERFLLHALDRYWHHGCLKCTCCGQALADMGRSFYFKGGMILCKNDYTRMFGSSGACAACGQAIPASEFVMRTSAPQQPLHVFHIKCFACSKCGSHLMQGDRYYMLAGSLVCEQDWQKLMKSASAATTAPVRKGKVGRPRRSRE